MLWLKVPTSAKKAHKRKMWKQGLTMTPLGWGRGRVLQRRNEWTQRTPATGPAQLK